MSIDGFRGARAVSRALFAAAIALGGCSSGSDDGEGGAGGGTGSDDASHGATGSGGAEPIDCAAECAAMGFEGGAADPAGCVCGEPLDEECFLGTGAVCACDASINQPCSDQDAFNNYVRCFQDVGGTRDLFLCINDYVEGTTVDCDAAKEGCVE